LAAFKKAVDAIIKVVENILWVLLSMAVIIVILQIFSRYVLGNSFTWTEQAARYLFIWMVMLGTPVLFHKKIFLAFDMIHTALPSLWQFIVNVLIKLSCMAFSVYYFYNSLQLVLQTATRYTSGFRVPFWMLYGAQPVFCVLLFLTMAALLIEDVMDWKDLKLGKESCK